jgi:hypothetical protein
VIGMDLEIGEVTSTMRTMDSDALVSPRVLEKIVAAVMQAMKDGQGHDKRAMSERAITGGVSAERDSE